MKTFLSLLFCEVFGLAAIFSLMTIAVQAQSGSHAAPVKTELRKTATGYQLYRNGQPYFVKGAGGDDFPARIAAYGGNSIRTWGTEGAQRILDSAYKNGLTVLLGLHVASERHGFNYDDTVAVRKQMDKLRGEVLKYKDHPAVLAWGIGNELNLHYKNVKVWNAVNDISKMIHGVDPDHPTTTVLAGVNKDLVDLIKERASDIDLLAINIYGPLATLPQTIRQSGWGGAYLVTEWGPTGHWESLQTAWQSSIEETSSEKAAVYKSRYEYSIEKDKERCLGSYVFLWGQKQERTPTWYGLFTEKGEESEVVDVMQYLWSGKWPLNKAPHLYSLQLDSKKALNNIYLKPGSSYNALTVAADPDKDKLTYRWEVLPEPTQLSEGGDFEARPKPVEGLITVTGEGKAILKAPGKEGAYRLLVYVTDGHNNVATANIPFYVRKTFFKKHVVSSVFVSEGSATGDVNNDGRIDILAGAYWYEAPGWKRHTVHADTLNPVKGYSTTFLNFCMDVNNDGWADLIKFDVPGGACTWYENPQTANTLWKRRLILSSAGFENPLFTDVDLDGRKDIICNDAATKQVIWLKSPIGKGDTTWQRYVISSDSVRGTHRYTHGLGWGDMNLDGKNDVIIKSGWWESPGDVKRKDWTFHEASLGADCANMFALDADRDGDVDVLSSSAHDYGIWWHEQQKDDKGNPAWITHEISKLFSQSHAMAMDDINEDGYPDLITGKRFGAHNEGDPGAAEPAVLYWFEYIPGKSPRWIPHEIDNNSGIGNSFVVSDINKDGLSDIIISNKKGVYFFEQARQ